MSKKRVPTCGRPRAPLPPFPAAHGLHVLRLLRGVTHEADCSCALCEPFLKVNDPTPGCHVSPKGGTRPCGWCNGCRKRLRELPLFNVWHMARVEARIGNAMLPELRAQLAEEKRERAARKAQRLATTQN